MQYLTNRLSVVAAVALLLNAPLTPAQSLPETPAARQYAAWRKAQESGDSATIQKFLDEHMKWGRVQQELAMATRSGGYDLRRVEESSATRLIVLAQERGPAKQFTRITLNVEASPPNAISGIGVAVVDPPADLAPPKLTAQEAEAAKAAAPFRQFTRWLEAFNSGDRSTISSFLSANFPTRPVEAEMNLRGQMTGFEMRALEYASPTTASGLVSAREGDEFARFLIEVEPAEPHRITRLTLRVVPRPAAYALAPLSETALVAALRERLTKDTEADRFAGAVILAKLTPGGPPKVLFSDAYGLADREKNIANTLDTRFRVGSMNKMFTGTAILQLVQAGKITLTDPLGKYLTDYPNTEVARKVTIHHLLTHTGGTGDIFGPEFAARRLELRTLDDYVKLYGRRDPLYEPGSRWQYSNYGMLLLGVIVEKVSGKSYYDYVADHIFTPAGMTRSGSEPENVAVEGRSVGYMGTPGRWAPNDNTLPYRGTSAGGGYSTVNDLMKFAAALMANKLLDARHTELLITGKEKTPGGGMYAYGFDDARVNGAGSVGHGGGAPGMNGMLSIYPKTGYVVAVLSNLNPPAAQRVADFIGLRLAK